jgi:hypothetical protein
MIDKPNWVRDAAAALVASGLKLPAPIAAAMEGKALLPLAFDTRARLPEWCEANGYSNEQMESLNVAISHVVRWTSYHESVATEYAVRFDLDGKVSEPVSPMDRHSAALLLLRRAMLAKDLPTLKEPTRAEPPPPPAPKPSASASKGKPTLTLKARPVI